ncbi:MAG: PepSY domain-containing protein [Dechloromonas sp.]|nr:PepSY domain-containing protein [Dechloromonas sp.]
MWKIQQLLIGLAMLLLGPLAMASPPAEKKNCTDLPRSQWLSEARIRQTFGADGYVVAQLKVSSTRCYEFYAIGQGGEIIEIYFHPISGEVIKRTVITPQTLTAMPAPAN